MPLPSLPHGHSRSLLAGEALFRTGDPCIGLVLVRRGALELRRVSAEGRTAILHRAGPGESFAEAALFAETHHCDGIAAVASEVTIHPAATLRRAAMAEPALAWALTAHLAARLVEERARAQRLALPRAEDRLLDLLGALPASPDGARRIGRSWKAVAAELGLTHEAVYRALARLERAGRLARPAPGVVRL
ncbi:Crp/Fnr family transcriptional regulator [Falsiroseomonas sp. HC035]|uniref:Crp/Fnr family transcriptional regulator n=1 Tax=Falsiroseomonas sp. HC035 TaxID=3390999 RepID=UPI003D31DA57